MIGSGGYLGSIVVGVKPLASEYKGFPTTTRYPRGYLVDNVGRQNINH
jgi:hypothetical protein